jgi:hypothetical protein
MTPKEKAEKDKKDYMVKKLHEHLNNPKPVQKPPYNCPMGTYRKSDHCKYPNCLCEWHL